MSDVEPDIMRAEREDEFDLAHWYLLGLNVFEYNDVPCSTEQRPKALFLTDLTRRLHCAAHVSSLALKDLVAAPEEMFGPPTGTTPYLRTRVGFHDTFYDLNEYPCFDACFFPLVTPLFWQALTQGDALDDMISNHGLAFYVDPKPNAMAEMERLLDAPFPGESQWLHAVTGLYGLVVKVGHDGQFFEAYAREEAGLDLLSPSLAIAVAAVAESEWYQTHKAELAWGDEFKACLMLPERPGAIDE